MIFSASLLFRPYFRTSFSCQFKDPEDLTNSLADEPDDDDNGGQPPVFEPLVLARPEVRSIELNLAPCGSGVGAAAAAAQGHGPPPPPHAAAGLDDFVLLACDGLFDVCSNQEAVSFALSQLKAHGDPRQAARALAKRAIAKGSSDNVSVLLVLLRPDLVLEGKSHSTGPSSGSQDNLPKPLPTAPVVRMPLESSRAPPAASPLSPSTRTPSSTSAAADSEAGATQAHVEKHVDLKFFGAGPLGLQLGQEQGTGWLRVSRVKPEGRAEAAGLRKHAIVVGITGSAQVTGSGSGSPQAQADVRMMPHEEAADLLKAHLEAGELNLTVVYGDGHE